MLAKLIMKKQIRIYALLLWLLLSIMIIGTETENVGTGVLCSVGGLLSTLMAGYTIYRADKAGLLPKEKEEQDY